MTSPKIKLCGLSREADIQAVNQLHPDYIGFVFFEKSSRYVSPDRARKLKALLAPGIQAVGVFVDEDPAFVAQLLDSGIIDLAQLHGHEDEEYIAALRKLTAKPLIQAFKISNLEDVHRAEQSSADYILLDHGAGGTGQAFDWSLIQSAQRPYFLAGGLHPNNVQDAVHSLHPYALDVSSGIEKEKVKDPQKMQLFVERAREA